jgi:hypothetical protein
MGLLDDLAIFLFVVLPSICDNYQLNNQFNGKKIMMNA